MEFGESLPSAPLGSRGRPSPRSPMMVRWISLAPPGIVHSHDPMKSSIQAPDSQPLDMGFVNSVWAASPADLRPEIRHPLQQFAVVQLDDGGVGRSSGPSLVVLDHFSAQPAQSGELGFELRQPVGHDRRSSTGPLFARSHLEPALPRRSASSSIVMPRSAPSVACATCHPAFSAPTRFAAGIVDVVEEHLAEVRIPDRLADRPDLDAGCRHIQQEVRNAVALGRIRIGPGQQQAPVGVGSAAGPQFLAVDDVVVTVAPRRRHRLARSDPASGSEKPCTQISPSRIAGRWRRRCWSVPATSRVAAA